MYNVPETNIIIHALKCCLSKDYYMYAMPVVIKSDHKCNFVSTKKIPAVVLSE